jgi:hypothetical protein
MWVRFEAKPVSELVTQRAGDESYHKLSGLNGFHFDNCWVLIIVRSGPVLMLARVRTFGETDDKISHRARHCR